MKLIAYDLGTGGIKSSLFDENGHSLAESFIQYETYFPQKGWHEQAPMDWWRGVCASTKRLLEISGCDSKDIVAAALSGHNYVTVPMSRSGELLSEVVGMRDAAVARLFHDEKETIISLSPSLATKLVNSSASELNALEKWLDRINASCKHQCDNLRTMISYEKERLKL